MTHSDSDANAKGNIGAIQIYSGSTGLRGALPRRGFRKGMCMCFIVAHETPTVNLIDKVQNEWARYILLDAININQNPIIWWANKRFEFPMLSNLAKHFLCIPGTSEHVFFDCLL